jgi:hypothetical protein
VVKNLDALDGNVHYEPTTAPFKSGLKVLLIEVGL